MELKLSYSGALVDFNPPISVEGSWMIGLTTVEVYNSIFNITEEINNFKLYKFPVSNSGGILYEKVREEMEKDLESSDFTATDLQNELFGPMFFKEFRKKNQKG